MTLRRRIGKLGAARTPVEWPRAIYICGPDGDPRGTLIVGSGSLERKDGESAEAFRAWAVLAVAANLKNPDTPRPH
jgi:hypothetical protein